MAHADPLWQITFLREWRKSKDISLETASEPMGITHGQLSKIERGIHPYSQNVLEVAAKLYGCTVQDLLTRKPKEREEVFSIWTRLNEGQRRTAASILRSLIEDDDEARKAS